MIDLDWIISKIRENDYIFSQHADEERMNDNLMIFEIEESILHGSILESYPKDKRGSSCLVVGFTKSGKPLHTLLHRLNTLKDRSL